MRKKKIDGNAVHFPVFEIITILGGVEGDGVGWGGGRCVLEACRKISVIYNAKGSEADVRSYTAVVEIMLINRKNKKKHNQKHKSTKIDCCSL